MIILDKCVWAQDNFMFNALFFSFVIDGHVSKYTERKLSNLFIFVFEDRSNMATIENFTELFNKTNAQKWFNTHIAESDITESFQQVNQIWRIFFHNILFTRVQNERFGHLGRWLTCYYSLNSIVIDRKALVNESCGFSHFEFIVFEEVLHVWKGIVEELSSNGWKSKWSKKKSRLLAYFSRWWFQKWSYDLENSLFNHRIGYFGLVDEFVKSLKSISLNLKLKVFDQKHFFEFGDHAIKYSDSDL